MQAFRILGAEIHPALNEIRLDGRVERLPPKFIDVLVVLAESGDALVSKAELLRRVWGDPLVGDEALSHAVWVLRKALGDDAKRPRFIQTVPRRGYRLMMAPELLPVLTEPAPQSPQQDADHSVPPSLSGRRFGRWRLATFAVAALCCVGLAALGLSALNQAVVAHPTGGVVWRLGDRLTRFDRLDDGRLLLATRSAELLLWSAARSQPDWRVRLGAPSTARALQVGQTLLVPSDDHFLYAFDVDTGREAWRFMAEAAIRATPAVAEGSVVVGDDHGNVLRIGLSDRQVIWRSDVGGRLRRAVLVVDEVVLVADTEGRLSALSLQDGKVEWQMSLGRPINTLNDLAAVNAGMAGDVLVGTDAGRVMRLNVREQAVRWDVDTGEASGDPVYLDRRAFLLTRQGRAWMLNLEDGRPIWQTTLDVPGAQQPVATPNGLVVMLSGARLGVLDPQTGDLNLRLGMPGAVDAVQTVQDGWSVAGLDGQIRFVSGIEALTRGDWRLASSGRPVPDTLGANSEPLIERGESNQPLEIAWTAATQGNAQDLNFAANGDLLLGDASGVTRMTPEGERRWQFALRQSPGTQFTMAHGLVLFGGNDGTLYALEEDSGQPRWQFTTGDMIRSRPVVVEDVVVFGGVDHNLYCLDVASGQLRWQFATQGAVHAEVAIDKRRVFAGSGDQQLYALTLDDGRLLWRRPMQEWIVAAPLVDQNRLFVPVADGSLRALEPETGRELWRFSSNGTIWFGLANDGQRVYFASGDGHVYAVDQQTGRERWRQRIGPQAEGRLALTNEHLFAGSPEGYLYSLNPVSGAVQWRMRTGAAVFNPAVQPPFVAVGSADQVVHVLRMGAAPESLPALPSDRDTVASIRQ